MALASIPDTAVVGAKDDVKDDLTKRLRHDLSDVDMAPEVNRAFSAGTSDSESWGVAPGSR
jgi:hypothetical protein